MTSQDSLFVNLLERVHRLIERVLRPFEPALSAVERLLQLLERLFNPVNRFKGVMCALCWLLTLVGYLLWAALQYFGMSFRISGALNVPVPVSLLLSYCTIAFLVFLFLIYFCQGRRMAAWIWLLLSPIVGLSLIWLSLEIRAQLFAQWLARLEFDSWARGAPRNIFTGPAIQNSSYLIYDYGHFCSTAIKQGEIRTALEVWQFLAPFHLYAASIALVAAICIFLTRVLTNAKLRVTHCLGTTVLIIALASLLTLTDIYNSEGPNGFGVYTDAQRLLNPITKFFRAVVDIHVDITNVKAVDVKREFWKFGCAGSPADYLTN
jgi:hypothetical protein